MKKREIQIHEDLSLSVSKTLSPFSKFSIKGYLRIEGYKGGPRGIGSLGYVFEEENVVVNDAKYLICRAIAGEYEFAVAKMMWGSSGTAAQVTDRSLILPVTTGSPALPYVKDVSYELGTSGSPVHYDRVTFGAQLEQDELNGETLREEGLFITVAGGTYLDEQKPFMFTRRVFTEMSKTSDWVFYFNHSLIFDV